MFAKILLFLEMEAENHRYARILSKFCLKVACSIIKNTPFA